MLKLIGVHTVTLCKLGEIKDRLSHVSQGFIRLCKTRYDIIEPQLYRARQNYTELERVADV